MSSSTDATILGPKCKLRTTAFQCSFNDDGLPEVWTCKRCGSLWLVKQEAENDE